RGDGRAQRGQSRLSLGEAGFSISGGARKGAAVFLMRCSRIFSGRILRNADGDPSTRQAPGLFALGSAAIATFVTAINPLPGKRWCFTAC
ncbi:hypothetical protein, partial [Bosea sp. BH3]|uniref:hypothetical protein n=1 Tax=Bosea sp. BH3 TaxID=2871701 RepID=UPI0021CB4651